MNNFILSELSTNINLGIKRRLRFIYIKYNILNLNIIKILYKNGAIRTYTIKNKKIAIYFKYFLKKKSLKLEIISTPGNRKFITNNNLSSYYNKNNFSGFLILSTSKGIFTSNCLLLNHISGEILLKVEI